MMNLLLGRVGCPSRAFQVKYTGVNGSSEVPERKRKERERNAIVAVVRTGDQTNDGVGSVTDLA
jgi:hypothetical protein